MEKLLFFGACLVASASSPVMAQTGGPALVVVRVTETPGEFFSITVTRGADQTEETLVNGKDLRNTNNAPEACAKVFAQLYQEGYALKGTYGGGVGPGTGRQQVGNQLINTLIFTKGQ